MFVMIKQERSCITVNENMIKGTLRTVLQYLKGHIVHESVVVQAYSVVDLKQGGSRLKRCGARLGAAK